METTDQQLLLRYRDAHDAAAFAELVQRYEKPLYGYLVRLLRRPAMAEDVFQATFLRVHRKCHTFQEGKRVRPWLYSIATHLAIDALRREGRHRQLSLEDEAGGHQADAGRLIDLLESATPSPIERMEEAERAEWTHQAIDGLPDNLRVILLLIYFQGLKYQDVAEILQLPLGTVKSRVHRALLMLNAAWRQSHLVD